MRRGKQEITDRNEIDEIIRKSTVCRLGMADEGMPYVTPICFGYDGTSIFFHSARAGMRIDIIRKNDRVCFEFDEYGKIETAEKACNFGISYRSVIGFGRAIPVDDEDEKKSALDTIMAQYSNHSFEYEPKMLDATAVFRIDIESITGKRSS